jgi:hypothetical protein
VSNLDQAWKRSATLRRKIQVLLKELEGLEELQGRLQEAKPELFLSGALGASQDDSGAKRQLLARCARN